MQQNINFHFTLTPNESTPLVGALLRLHLEQNPESRVRDRRNTFISFCNSFSHQKVTQLTPASVRAWMMQLKERKGYCDRNMNHIKSDLNYFFNFLVQNDYLRRNPLSEVKFSRRYTMKRNRVILSHNEVIQALAATQAHSPDVVYPFIFALAHTGARREEIRLLKWEHIDFETGYMTIKNTKSGWDRSIKMGPSLLAFLQALPRKADYIFMNQFGWLLSREQIDDTIAAIQKKNPGMKKWRCHDLRHSFAYNFLIKGGEMYALKAILGHKTIQLTIDLYGNFRACDVGRVSPYEI